MSVISFAEKAGNAGAIVVDSIFKADSILNQKGYQNIAVSISGGSDSDIVLDMCSRLRADLRYVFFDTGIEYGATQRHLLYLEERYGIKIERIPASVPVPLGCSRFGVPFLSKFVSDNIYRLQKNGFQWEDRPFSELIRLYPDCGSALKWWCNQYRNEGYESSFFEISRNRYLKDFLLKHPPEFAISSKCCDGAKKYVSHRFNKENNIELSVIGVRRAEGGIRKLAYSSCFASTTKYGNAQYRPLFWYRNEDKIAYERTFDICHSDCYTVYGFKRTGCCCCPFGKEFDEELRVVEEREPKLYKAVNNIFGKSYSYTRKYREFCRQQKGQQKRAA